MLDTEDRPAIERTDCAEGGRYSEGGATLAWGLGPDRKMRHIREVARGRACECVCPSCKTPLEAVKPTPRLDVAGRPVRTITPHFRHHQGSECRTAAQTALHLLAGEIFSERQTIRVPGWDVNSGNLTKGMSDATVNFDQVKLEYLIEVPGDDEERRIIIPDIVARRRSDDRILLIEIYVTHRVSAEKQRKIEQLGLPCIEIDLSKAPRDAAREEIAELLNSAPRDWIFNPKARQAQNRLDDEERLRQQRERERIDKQIDALISAAGRPPKPLVGDTPYVDEFAHLTNLPLAGEACFSVCRQDWQSVVIEAILTPHLDSSAGWVPSYHVIYPRDILAALRERGCIKPEFLVRTSQTFEEILAGRAPSLKTPYRVVRGYLAALQSKKFIFNSRGNEWYSSQKVSERMADVREERRSQALKAHERAEREKKLLQHVERILESIPEDERNGMTTEQWVHHNSDQVEIARAGGVNWSRLDNLMGRLSRMANGSEPAEPFVGLPLEKTYERSVFEAARREEIRKQRDEEMRLRQAEKRIEILESHAQSAALLDWIDEPHHSLGITPREHAFQSDADLDRTLGLLRQEEYRCFEAQRVEKWKEKVLDELTAVYGDRETAEAYGKMKDKLCDGLSPLEYCTNDAKLHQYRKAALARRWKRR